jgi:uncharacterized secreted protein with C-terminal beta-propeller domain
MSPFSHKKYRIITYMPHTDRADSNPPTTDQKGRNLILALLLGSIGMVLLVIISITAILFVTYSSRRTVTKPTSAAVPSKLSYAASCEDLKAQIGEYDKYRRGIGGLEDKAMAPIAGGMQERNTNTPYYTGTNTQVIGVDEGDTVKTDGKHVFTIDQSRSLIKITQVFPFNEARVIGEINFKTASRNGGSSPIEMYLSGNRLIVFTHTYSYSIDSLNGRGAKELSLPALTLVSLYVFDVSNPSAPKELRKVDVEGSFTTSRFRDGMVYLISNTYMYNTREPGPVPLFRDSKAGETFRNTTECNEIAILDPGYVAPSFTTVTALNITLNDAKPVMQNYIGNTQSVYMSYDNIYLVSQRSYFESSDAILPMIGIRGGGTYIDKSVLTKLSYQKDRIEFSATNSFDGHLLNQFSLDEYEGFLRIAGTVGDTWGNNSTSYLKIFNKSLEQVSVIDNLARGERIYSVRFNGKIGTVVTFKKVDPLFVFDLSDPYKPILKGELKIPGYSDYLHFIDDRTVIGFGKDAIEANTGMQDRQGMNFAWYQGLKMALFDISDMSNPKEISKVMLGDRGSESPALSNHRAFTYDPQNKVIIVPAYIAKIDPATCKQDQSINPCYGTPSSQGAQVIRIKDGKELTFAGEIAHGSMSASLWNSYAMGSESTVTRAMIIDTGIVTISNSKIMVNDIATLQSIKSITLR